MGSLKDYWSLLGLASGASEKAIHTAYRKQSLAVHPDRYRGADAEGAKQRFLDLTEAKETLCDEKARRAWEKARAAAAAAAAARAAHAAARAAQGEGRRRLREALEAREEGAARGEEELRREEEAAAAALRREMERLRREGRLEARGEKRRREAEGALPEGWREAEAGGRVYYYHAATRATQWERPEAEAAEGAAALEAQESVTLRRLRQAAERQRLVRQMEEEGGGEARRGEAEGGEAEGGEAGG